MGMPEGTHASRNPQRLRWALSQKSFFHNLWLPPQGYAPGVGGVSYSSVFTLTTAFYQQHPLRLGPRVETGPAVPLQLWMAAV